MRLCTRCPRQDSNLRSRLRRAVLYPLSYGGGKPGKPSSGALRSAGGRKRRAAELRAAVASIWMISLVCAVAIDCARVRT